MELYKASEDEERETFVEWQSKTISFIFVLFSNIAKKMCNITLKQGKTQILWADPKL